MNARFPPDAIERTLMMIVPETSREGEGGMTGFFLDPRLEIWRTGDIEADVTAARDVRPSVSVPRQSAYRELTVRRGVFEHSGPR